jgi:hypothetical protein
MRLFEQDGLLIIEPMTSDEAERLVDIAKSGCLVDAIPEGCFPTNHSHPLGLDRNTASEG